MLDQNSDLIYTNHIKQIFFQLFLTYLYSVSIMFLLLLEFYLIRKARKHGPRRPKKKPQADIVISDGLGNTVQATDGRATFDNLATVRSRRVLEEYQPPVQSEYDSASVINNEPFELFVIGAEEDEDPSPHQTSLYLRIGGACKLVDLSPKIELF